MRSQARKAAHFAGVITCRQVWACPVCATRAAVKRVQELSEGIGAWMGGSVPILGGSSRTVLLLTLTHSHGRKDSLGDLVRRNDRARQRFWRRGTVRRYLKRIGVVHRITAYETTWGEGSGWHPHLHVLLFVEWPKVDTAVGRLPMTVDLSEVEERLRGYWLSALRAEGLDGNEHACRVDGGEKTAAYLNKLALECGLSSFKRGREGRYSPFALLQAYVDGDDEKGARFAEYAMAMKGKSTVRWSSGSKEALGVQVVTDEEACEALEPDSVEFVWLEKADYGRVRQAGQGGALLDAVGQLDWELFTACLQASGVDLLRVGMQGVERPCDRRPGRARETRVGGSGVPAPAGRSSPPIAEGSGRKRGEVMA